MAEPVDNAKFRVLMVSAYFESHRGGIEIVAGHLAREFKALGHKLVWAASASDAAPADAGSILPLRSINAAERFGLPLPIPYPSSLQQLKRAVENADLILLHDTLYPANIVAFLCARAACKPVVIVQHIAAVPYRNVLLRNLMRAAVKVITKPLLARAAQTVFISEAVATQFEDVRFAAQPEIVFNGVDSRVFTPPATAGAKAELRKQFDLPVDGDIATFAGRFVEKKGLGILARVAQERPDITFVLAGRGPIDPRSWNLPNVRVMTDLAHDSLADLYRASDVFVLPSLGEGFPLVVQEAMACGLPVVCGSETAEADAAAIRFLNPVFLAPNADEANAARVAAKLDATMCEPPECSGARAAFAALRYDWKAAAARYDAIFTRLGNHRCEGTKRRVAA